METIKWCYCVQGKGNGTLNNELVKDVGKSLMQGVGLNLVLTLWAQAVPRWQKTGKRYYFGSQYQAFFHTHKNVFPPDSLNLQEPLTEVWRNIILFSYLSPGYYFELMRSSFPSTFTGRLPSLVVSLYPQPPQQPFPLHHHTSLLHSLPSASLPGRLQIGYFLHALSRALIRGRVLIVGLSLRLTDSSACAAEMPDLVNVCLWCLISSAYINCLDSMCRQSLSILLHCLPPPSVSISPFSLYSVPWTL